MEITWVQNGDDYYLRDRSQQIEHLPPGVYRLEIQMPFEQLYLRRMADEFRFPYKIYDLETGLLDRVERTYAHTTGNLGVLLNGLRGTGKSVTASLLCNRIGLPVILVSHNFPQFPAFLNEIPQDVTVFLDEFEKTYEEKDHSLLSVMDGALKSSYRRMFVLTTNHLLVNPNLIERPGRVRYVKEFGDLSLPAIGEVVDDLLAYPELRAETIKFISELRNITIDTVKAIIQEVNIHRESPEAFREVFNVRLDEGTFNLYEVLPDGGELLRARYVQIGPYPFRPVHVVQRNDFMVGSADTGEIVEVHDENTVTVENWLPKGRAVLNRMCAPSLYVTDGYYLDQLQKEQYAYRQRPAHKDNDIIQYRRTFRVERARRKHSVFSEYGAVRELVL